MTAMLASQKASLTVMACQITRQNGRPVLWTPSSRAAAEKSSKTPSVRRTTMQRTKLFAPSSQLRWLTVSHWMWWSRMTMRKMGMPHDVHSLLHLMANCAWFPLWNTSVTKFCTFCLHTGSSPDQHVDVFLAICRDLTSHDGHMDEPDAVNLFLDNIHDEDCTTWKTAMPAPSAVVVFLVVHLQRIFSLSPTDLCCPTKSQLSKWNQFECSRQSDTHEKKNPFCRMWFQDEQTKTVSHHCKEGTFQTSHGLCVRWKPCWLKFFTTMRHFCNFAAWACFWKCQCKSRKQIPSLKACEQMSMLTDSCDCLGSEQCFFWCFSRSVMLFFLWFLLRIINWIPRKFFPFTLEFFFPKMQIKFSFSLKLLARVSQHVQHSLMSTFFFQHSRTTHWF